MEQTLCYGCMEYIEPGSSCPCGFDPSRYEPEPHHLLPGTLMQNRYQVGRVLGEGGFGITYVGRDMLLDMRVAVKEFYMSGYVNRNCSSSSVVRANTGSYKELFERNREKFLNEARVLAKFSNEDGIVGIRDFFQANNTAYIIMDFLGGETLRDHLKRQEKLSASETLRIMEPILRSLANVHRHNVIHRDISPDNIMLTENGKVKLLDFGAARQISQHDIRSLSVILKPGYAPEEQYRSKGRQGPWTDVYSLCATMYHCITGMVPEDSMERLFEEKVDPPCVVEPTCSRALSDAIMKGLAVRKKDRYQSIEELQQDLRRAMEQPDIPLFSEPETEPTSSADEKNAPASPQAPDPDATVYAGRIQDAAAQTLPPTAIISVREQPDHSAQAQPRAPDPDATVYAGWIQDAAAQALPPAAVISARERPDHSAQAQPQAQDLDATVYADGLRRPALRWQAPLQRFPLRHPPRSTRRRSLSRKWRPRRFPPHLPRRAAA